MENERIQIRLVFTDAPGRVMPEHSGKIFAMIGPFESFTDQPALMLELEALVRGYNEGVGDS